MKLHELNKMTADPKASNYLSVPHTSKRGVENQDPTSPHNVQKALRRLGISRLPVLAKSLHLQTPSDFTQSHKRWEENSLVVSGSFPGNFITGYVSLKLAFSTFFHVTALF